MKRKQSAEHNITSLIVIGGAEDKHHEKHILRRFVEMSGGEAAEILVVPIASDFPEIAAGTYDKIFTALGARRVEIFAVASRREALQIDPREMLEGISGVFVSGGDQMRLSTQLGGTPFIRQLKERIRDGVVLAGSSAGAAAMSNAMIVRGKPSLQPKKDAVRLAPGLGILENIIIDQHFSERTRLNRLITAVTYNPHNLGIGIDEDTAIIINREGVLTAIGSGTVTIVDGGQIEYTNMADTSPTLPFAVTGLKLHILTRGISYNLNSGEIHENPETLASTDSEKQQDMERP